MREIAESIGPAVTLSLRDLHRLLALDLVDLTARPAREALPSRIGRDRTEHGAAFVTDAAEGNVERLLEQLEGVGAPVVRIEAARQVLGLERDHGAIVLLLLFRSRRAPIAVTVRIELEAKA